VLFISSSGDLFGGAERCLVEVAPRILARGYAARVVVPFHGALEAALADRHVPTHTLNLGVPRSRRELRSPRLLWRMAAIPGATVRLARLMDRSTSVVHSNTSIVIAGALAARIRRRPHVWHIREIPRGPAWRLLRPLILRLSQRVLCISAAVADNVAPVGSAARHRLTVVPDGVDVEFFRPPAVAPTGPPRIAMVARINPWKGHAQFLEAASLLARGNPTAVFTIVGGVLPAYQPLYVDLLRMRSRLDLDTRLEFVPHLDRPALRDLLQSLAVLVLPSTSPEPGGLVALEAMACGVPVVATRQGGPLDIITDGVDGRLVPSGQPRAMASAIDDLLQDTTLRRRLGEAGRRRVETAYSLDAHVERLIQIYDDLLTA
jgi:glycosyltransferase involved in cell wall biosynthesis